ncbi:MAG: phosphate ABC transporter ATP-binding protein [SAR202 cluster bacterium]|nr:phosphate ABC transporter ATP-binding protein [SAR202 cluster bacterium]|tara:strand:- start:1878 stop:2678 length:801 start_codon:yes stop_codon:yes gene_type:complete
MDKNFIDRIDSKDAILKTEDLSVFYGNTKAVDRVTFSIPRNKIVALIGPSGCGKSTLIRCFNRMNDLIPSAKVEGIVHYNDVSIYSDQADPTDIRFKIGMVFQKPNPFPKTIFENVAFGPKINGFPSNEIEGIVESSLKQAGLWDEVKDRLQDNGLDLSGGQQQRLCIARALAVNPDIILMDEPASALDPVSTSKLEDLVKELSKNVTIIIVTHNMQQATRICDYAAVMMAGEERIGELIEYGTNDSVFGNPKDKRTEDYVTGRIG